MSGEERLSFEARLHSVRESNEHLSFAGIVATDCKDTALLPLRLQVAAVIALPPPLLQL